MKSTLFKLFLFALCAAPLSAQSFNIDFGQPGTGPASTYGGAGLPGYWNAIVGDGTDVVLKNTAGVTTSVHFWQSGAPGLIAGSDPSVSGDDALLLNDGLITHTFGTDACFYFNGLVPGNYELITYAWRPSAPTLMAKNFVDNTVGVEITGGAWTGQHVHGVTFARHIVLVTGSQFIGSHSGLNASGDAGVGEVCNGIQLRRLDTYVPFCFGDGTGTACPCGNSGALSSGCANSSFSAGAFLSSSGTAGASAGTDTLVLTATNMPGPGIFFQGTATVGGGLGTVFGDGLMCAGGTVTRMGVVFPTAGSASYPGGLTPSPIHIAGSTVSGNVRQYQCWFRDSAAFCASETYNLTTGLTVTWSP